MALKRIPKKTKELFVFGSYIIILLLFAGFEANRKKNEAKMPSAITDNTPKDVQTSSHSTITTFLDY